MQPYTRKACRENRRQRIQRSTLFNTDYYHNLWTPFEALSPMSRPLYPCALTQTTHVSQTLTHALYQPCGNDAGQAICTYTVAQKHHNQETTHKRSIEIVGRACRLPTNPGAHVPKPNGLKMKEKHCAPRETCRRSRRWQYQQPQMPFQCQ
jgi:hypothetical protein